VALSTESSPHKRRFRHVDVSSSHAAPRRAAPRATADRFGSAAVRISFFQFRILFIYFSVLKLKLTGESAQVHRGSRQRRSRRRASAVASRRPRHGLWCDPNPAPTLSLTMVTCEPGVLVVCDIPIKQFLLYLDEKQDGPGARFIIANLDDTHLFVKQDAINLIREELDKLFEENQYSFIQ
jgi:hypothetical protein